MCVGDSQSGSLQVVAKLFEVGFLMCIFLSSLHSAILVQIHNFKGFREYLDGGIIDLFFTFSNLAKFKVTLMMRFPSLRCITYSVPELIHARAHPLHKNIAISSCQLLNGGTS